MNDLKPNPLALKRRKRVGRGIGSNYGKNCGKGMNGQRSRSGKNVPLWFEGGQNPLYRRVPKRGFTNIFKTQFYVLNFYNFFQIKEKLSSLDKIDQNSLISLGVIPNKNCPVKLLAKMQPMYLEEKLDYNFLSGKTIEVDFASEVVISKAKELNLTLKITEVKKKPKKKKFAKKVTTEANQKSSKKFRQTNRKNLMNKKEEIAT